MPRMPIPGVGWLACLKDTEGNIFGIADSHRDARQAPALGRRPAATHHGGRAGRHPSGRGTGRRAVKSMLQAEVREEVRRRLASVPADRPPRWGRMDASRMMAHVADAMQMALGDLPVAPKRLPFRYPPFKQLILYVLPFPRGAPTATELVSRPPRSLDEERRAIDGHLERLAARDPAARGPEHPAFGPLTVRQWGVLGYKHVDHHLRQFGA